MRNFTKDKATLNNIMTKTDYEEEISRPKTYCSQISNLSLFYKRV